MTTLTLLPLFLLTGSFAHAYESDQLSSRLDPPMDATDAANTKINQMLAQAVALTNRQLRCQGDDATVREALAHTIHDTVGGRERVPGHDGGPPMAFGAYAAWLESGPIDRDAHVGDEGLYRDIGLRDSLLIATFGAASTISLGGFLVGTDKIDHFWVQGYDYFRRSREGRDPARAVAWGTRTELGVWGFETTGVFSYADLAANYDGFQFYATLLTPDSVLQRDRDGCVQQVRPFDWAEIINWRYDEVLNPSVYRADLGPPIRAAVEEEGMYCTQGLKPPEIDGAPWVGPDAPDWDTGLDLTDLCPPEPTASR